MINATTKTNDALARLLEISPEAVNQALKDAVDETTLAGESLIQRDTPIITSNLRNQIEAKPAIVDGNEIVGKIETNVEYASAVEFGTGIHSENPKSNKQPFRIYAKNGKALAFTYTGGGFSSIANRKETKTGDTVIRKFVTIQGQRPAAMFRKSMGAIGDLLRANCRKHTLALLRGENYV